MGRLEDYQPIIERILGEHLEHVLKEEQVETLGVCDEAGGHYMLLEIGWQPPRRVYSGEPDTAVIVALLVPLFGYNLQTGRVSVILLLTCLPFAALIFANMLNVSFPDYEADRVAGKRTLVVILGPERAARLFVLLLLVGYATPWLTLGWGLPLPVLLAEAATLPMGILSLREIARGGYRRPERFWRNTFLGASAVIAVGLAQVVGFLLAGVSG